MDDFYSWWKMIDYDNDDDGDDDDDNNCGDDNDRWCW